MTKELFDIIRDRKARGYDDSSILTELQNQYSVDEINSALDQLKHMNVGGVPNPVITPATDSQGPVRMTKSSGGTASTVFKIILLVVIIYLAVGVFSDMSAGSLEGKAETGWSSVVIVLYSPFIIALILIIKHLNK